MSLLSPHSPPVGSAALATSDSTSWKRRNGLLIAAVWAACSIALLVARPSYPFPPFELLDSWIYTAYQWDLRNQIADFGPTYYGARLSWILPGALLHSLLPPVAAGIVFKLLFSVLLAFACAGVVHAVAGLRWALVTTALTTFAPQIVVALQTDYVDGPVIVFAACTMAGITRAGNSPRPLLWIAVAGAGLAAMLATNIGAASTIGAGLAVFHLVWLRWGLQRTLRAAVAYAAGAALVLLVLAASSRSVGGEFNFLQPQFDMIRYFKEVDRNPWVPTNFEWLTRASWLILPVGAALWAAVRLVVTRREKTAGRRLILALTAGLATSLLFSAIIEFRATGAVLSLYYYASFNLTFALPLLVLTAADHGDGSPPTWTCVVALIGALFALVTVVTPVAGWMMLSWVAQGLGAADRVPIAAAALLALGTILIVISASGRRVAAPAGLFLFCSWLLLSLPASMHGPEVSDRLRERYQAVHEAYFLLKRELPNRSFRFWVDAKHRDGVSLASTKLWGYRLLTQQSFPELESVPFRDLTVVVPLAPGRGPAAIEQLPQVLKARHLVAENTRLRPISGKAGTGFDLLMFELRSAKIDPESDAPHGFRAEMIAGYEYYRDPPYTAQLQINRADGRSADAIMPATGHAVFYRGEPEDHLATEFRPLPPPPVNGFWTLAIITVMPVEGDLIIAVQDDQFRNHSSLALRAAGRAVHNVKLPPDANGYRLCFYSRSAVSTALPINLNVYRVETVVTPP